MKWTEVTSETLHRRADDRPTRIQLPRLPRSRCHLRGKGHEVVNPAELPAPDDPTWENYLRGALRAMLTCEAVVLLPGWVRSNGARLERMVADRLRIQVYDYAHFEITEEK